MCPLELRTSEQHKPKGESASAAFMTHRSGGAVSGVLGQLRNHGAVEP